MVCNRGDTSSESGGENDETVYKKGHWKWIKKDGGMDWKWIDKWMRFQDGRVVWVDAGRDGDGDHWAGSLVTLKERNRREAMMCLC